QGNLQIVLAHEPVESRPGLREPTILARRPVSFEAGGHRTPGFQRLLVKAGLCLSSTIEALRADTDKMGILRGMLGLAQPVERSEPGRHHRSIGTVTASSQHRLRQSGV